LFRKKKAEPMDSSLYNLIERLSEEKLRKAGDEKELEDAIDSQKLKTVEESSRELRRAWRKFA
jgi:hypothetical protein